MPGLNVYAAFCASPLRVASHATLQKDVFPAFAHFSIDVPPVS